MFISALTEWPHGFCTLHSLHPYPAKVVTSDTFKTTPQTYNVMQKTSANGTEEITGSEPQKHAFLVAQSSDTTCSSWSRR